MMKKYAAIVMMICLSASLLMGCGGSGGGEDKSSAAGSKAEAQEETAQAEEQQQGETAHAEEAQQAETGQEEAVSFEAQEEAQTDQLVSRDMPAPADGYIVFVKDANTEEPLADVRIQFCSDVQCLMGKTDNSGAAVFNVDPGNYEAHVYKPPVGYQKCSDTFKLTPDDRVAVFTLLKEGEELKAAEAADEADTAADETGDESSEEESGGLSKYDSEWSFDVTGFTFKVPERFKEYKGQYRASDRGETDFNSNMFITNILYLPRTDEEKEAMYTYMDGLTEEEMETEEFREKANEFYKFNLTVAQVVAIKNDVDFQTILDERVEDKSLIGATGKLGTAGDYSYYYLIPDYTSLVGDALKEELPEDMYAEYQDVMANVEQDLISGVTLKGPHRAVEVVPVGTKISFETTDLNGNPVSSADLFAGHKVTMINLWATWCTYCKEEMPRLEEMNKELAEKDCQIIGVCCEIEDDTVEQANKILKAKGVTYTNIAQTPEMVEMLPTLGMPTTYFVDSEGRVLTVPVRGANFEGYSEKLEQALKAVE